MQVLAVLTVRNEAAFLIEWLAHHQTVGFNRFLVFSNDCQDGTDAMLDRLEQLGHVTHLRNDGPYHHRGIQFTALKAAENTETVRDADWILPLDVDEFVNIHTGDGTVSALLDRLPQARAITLTWRLFGNADVAQYADDPVVDRFSRCAPEIMYWPWRSAMFKTLYRNDGTYRSLGVHRPRNPDPDRLDLARWFDGNGRDLPEEFRRRRIFSPFGRPNYSLAQLNHYPLGSKACFLLKRDRGRAVHSDHDLGMDYWVERNFNTDTDLSIKRYAERSRARREELLQDPELSRLHARAVAWRHMRFETLMEQEDYRALYGRLLGTPGSVPLGEAEARVLLQHAMKARAAQEGTD